MIGRCVWPVLVVFLFAVLLSEVFPGKRAAPDVPAIASMEWQGSESGMLRFFDQTTDIVICQEAKRQIAQQPGVAGGRFVLDCRLKSPDAAL